MKTRKQAIPDALRVINEFRKIRPLVPVQTISIFLEVAAREGQSRKELGDRVGISSGAMTRQAQALGETDRFGKPGMQLIETRQSQVDQRNAEVFLSTRGKMLVRSLQDILSDEED